VGSPTLLHNFYCGQVDGDVCPRASDQITLHPIRLGGPEPPVPIAHSITVARIASPSTVNKAYQHIFLQSLKKYFEFRTRLIRYGDIIAVPLDTGEDHLVEKLNELVNGGNKYHESVIIPKCDECLFKTYLAFGRWVFKPIIWPSFALRALIAKTDL
jgi:hypothetical protein